VFKNDFTLRRYYRDKRLHTFLPTRLFLSEIKNEKNLPAPGGACVCGPAYRRWFFRRSPQRSGFFPPGYQLLHPTLIPATLPANPAFPGLVMLIR
jgi:hypothetical protein